MRLIISVVLVLAVAMATEGADTAPARRPWLDPVTGEPFFPLGWYDWEDGVVSVPQGRPSLANGRKVLDRMAEQGANAIVFVNSWNAPETEEQLELNAQLARSFLDHAGLRGMKVIFTMGSHDAGRDDLIDLQRRWVTAIKDHPALLGYQGYDEPEFRLAMRGDDAAEKNNRFVQARVAQREAIRR